MIARSTFPRLLWTGLAVAGVASCVGPAQARLDIGIGIPIGNTGIHTGAGYRFGGWNDRFGTYIHLDAGRILNKGSRKRGSDRERESGRREEAGAPAPVRVDLLVSPGDARVLLNGRRIDADGRDTLRLPPGRHRLDFLRPGYRSEVAEINAEAGVRYRVQRKMERLEKGETPDSRLNDPGPVFTIEDAARAGASPAREGDPR